MTGFVCEQSHCVCASRGSEQGQGVAVIAPWLVWLDLSLARQVGSSDSICTPKIEGA